MRKNDLKDMRVFWWMDPSVANTQRIRRHRGPQNRDVSSGIEVLLCETGIQLSL